MLIDGVPIEEPYLEDGATTDGVQALTVPPGSIYVLSDNRSNSQDSRGLGPVFTDRVIGPVAVVNVPLDRLAVGAIVLFGAAFLALALLPSRARAGEDAG